MSRKQPVTEARILAVLNIIDWTGHVEIGDSDKVWLARILNDSINPPRDQMRCDSCDELKVIVVKTTIGNICEECLEIFTENAENTREDWEAANRA